MEGCASSFDRLIGRAKTLELAYGCPDVRPEESEWKLLGLPTSATWDLSPESLTSDADDGGFTSTMIASLDPTYSIDGEVRVKDRTDEFGIQQFTKYVVDEVRARRQPTVWMRFHWGDSYHIGYMVASGLSDGGGVKEIVTYSLELKLNEGTTFEIEPDGSDVPATGVTVTPTSASVAAGASTTFTVNVAPADASVKTFTVASSVPARATATINGNTVTVSAPSGATAGNFDYTFDDENDSLGDRVQAICNAASVVPYWDDGVLTFTRDQKVNYPAAVFNRANMKADEYKMTYEATLPGGYDGVQVSYVHPTNNTKTYINYRVLNGTIVEQEAENPNKMEIVGFRNEYQARERALRETKRLIYSRVRMNARVFEDGIIQVGSVIQMPDIYDSNQQQGYITGRAGNNFDTSEPITFTASMYVLVTDSLGNPTQRYPATARSDTKFGFTAGIPKIELNIWNGDTVQLPSRYLIATVEELDSQLWKVGTIKPNSDNTVSLSVADYSDAIYS